MDEYAKSMLHDDISPEEDLIIPCPSCQLDLHYKIVDQFVKCKRCGEIFYIEEVKDNELRD